MPTVPTAGYAVSAPPPYGPAHGQAYGYGYPAQPRTNGLSIASMVLSLSSPVVMICSACLFWPGVLLGGVTSVLGAILGHVGMRQVKARGERGGGMALTGVIVGWIFTALALIGVVLAVAFLGWAMSTIEQPPDNW